MARRELIIKDTHRGLYYEDGILEKVLARAGTCSLATSIYGLLHGRPTSRVMLVDVRERELTIKGQEILTADKGRQSASASSSSSV